MAVTFVIGRAGAGKTTRCFRRIVEAVRAEPLGPPILWLVPKQATFMAERDLACASGLPAICRARVVSFDQLVADVFAATGGAAVPQVTPLGRQMILGHLLRRLQPKLSHFRSVAHRAGLAAELDATFSELERCGKSSGDLAELVADLEVSDPADADGTSLLAKMRDLRLVYDTYHAFLGQDRLDPHRRLTQVLDLVRDCPFLRGAALYVDGFIDFTREEQKLLAAAAKVCATVEITLLADPHSPTIHDPHKLPDESSLFHRTEQAYRRLWFALQEVGVTVAEPVLLEDASSLSSIFYPLSSPPPVCPVPLELITATDRRSEVEAVARRVRELLREGMRLRDVAVLVRDLDDYHALLDAAFREHDLPYFVDRRRTAAHHPLLQFLRAVLLVARLEWPHESVISLLKTGLAGVTLDEADALENYVLLHRVRGFAWESAEPWAFRRSDLTRGRDDEEFLACAAAEAGRMDALRRALVERLRPLLDVCRPPAVTFPAAGEAGATVREFVLALLELFERCGVRRTMSEWMHAAESAGDLEQRGEHEQVWTELMELLEQMADLLGPEHLKPAEFADVLESGLEQFDLAIPPPTVDQVLVGQIDRTRTPRGLRAAFVLGLNAGEFPRAPRDGTVLSDVERRELRRRRVELEGDGRRSLLDERLLGYLAFTRALERLIVTRPVSPDGERPVDPSPFWVRLRELFPDVEPVEAPAERKESVADAWTPRQAVVSLMRWVRESQNSAPPLPSAGEGRGEGEALKVELRSFAPSSNTLPPHPNPLPQGARGPEPALYHWLATEGRHNDRIAKTLHQAWPALSYTNQASLSREVASALFPTPLTASAARLEMFAACPFRHFARYCLGLAEREEADVTTLDLSRVYHHVMEKLINAALRDGVDLSDPASAVTCEQIQAYARQIAHSLRGELMLSSARNEYLLRRVEKTLEEVIAAQCEMLRRGTFRPAKAGVTYGGSGAKSLDPLHVTTPGGAELRVRGTVDRVDLLPGGQAAVFDYRLGGRTLSFAEVYHGLSLQLLANLLAVESDGSSEATVKATAAFYFQLARGTGEVSHPSEALDPSDPRFLLRVKPRGVFDGTVLPALDASVEPGTDSEVVQVRINKDGRFGRRGSDAAAPEQFRALLDHVRRRMGELADGILSGQVSITPYRMNTATPCPRCEYRPVCWFDPTINRYRNLIPLGREQVLEQLSGSETSPEVAGDA